MSLELLTQVIKSNKVHKENKKRGRTKARLNKEKRSCTKIKTATIIEIISIGTGNNATITELHWK